MPPLKTQFHTYLIGSYKQFLHVVIFNDACHQTHRKSVLFHLYCCIMGQHLLSEVSNPVSDELPWSQRPHNAACLYDVLINKDMDFELHTRIFKMEKNREDVSREC